MSINSTTTLHCHKPSPHRLPSLWGLPQPMHLLSRDQRGLFPKWERLLEGLREMELQNKHVLKCCWRNYWICSASLLRPASLLLALVIISQLVFTRGWRDCDVHRPLNGPVLLCRALNHIVLQLSALPFNPTVRASVFLVNRGRWAWLTLLRRQFHQKRGEQRSQMGRKNRLSEIEARGIA